MATKDWKRDKPGQISYRDITQWNNIKKPNKVLTLHEDYSNVPGDSKMYWFVATVNLNTNQLKQRGLWKGFKTKTKALKYAKAYMRKH